MTNDIFLRFFWGNYVDPEDKRTNYFTNTRSSLMINSYVPDSNSYSATEMEK